MTSDGSPYARFQRAIRAGNLPLIYATATELGWVALCDALAILLVIDARDGGSLRARRGAMGRPTCSRSTGPEAGRDGRRHRIAARPPDETHSARSSRFASA